MEQSLSISLILLLCTSSPSLSLSLCVRLISLSSRHLVPSVSLLHPDYLETPISKRHLNSDVNVLIRSVNELKATQIKLMQP